MTDKTKCQHCGADGDKFGSGILFECGSVNEHQSDLCEVRELRAKVAAQQELLKEATEILSDAVPMLECGDDWNSPYVQRLNALSVKLNDDFPHIASPAAKSR